MQTIPGEALYDIVTEDLPRYRFAVAILQESGEVEIIESVPVRKPFTKIPSEGESWTENVVQTYAVQVPYTDIENGTPILKLRTEHRTRIVPINRIRPKKGEENKWEERTYTVSVPYTEKREDGGVVRRTRLETRTRFAHVDEPKSYFGPKEISSTTPLAALKCFSSSGEQLKDSEIKEKLRFCLPVLLISSESFLDGDYFSKILHPDSMIIVDPLDIHVVH